VRDALLKGHQQAPRLVNSNQPSIVTTNQVTLPPEYRGAQSPEAVFFYFLLTVHFSIILVINQLNEQILFL